MADETVWEVQTFPSRSRVRVVYERDVSGRLAAVRVECDPGCVGTVMGWLADAATSRRLWDVSEGVALASRVGTLTRLALDPPLTEDPAAQWGWGAHGESFDLARRPVKATEAQRLTWLRTRS